MSKWISQKGKKVEKQRWKVQGWEPNVLSSNFEQDNVKISGVIILE